MLVACDKGLTRGKSKSDYKAVDGKPFNGPDFEIDMPEGWEVQKGLMGTAIMATSAKEGPQDQFQENINITLENVPSSIGLDKYVEISIENAKKMLSDYKTVEQTKVTINGVEFCRIVALYNVGVVSIKGLLYVGIKDGGAYNVTCTASPETYDKFKAAFEKAVKSLKID
jgi:hypothetical protein